MHSNYSISARAYLRRAMEALASGDPALLFYAAFELRAGIEARLQEYLEHQPHVPEGRKNDWRIAKLGASIDKAFTIEKTARVQFLEQGSGRVLATVFYTPVPTELRLLGERLGDYLHAQSVFREPTDSWWGTFRTTLDVGCHLLSDATSGSLLGPPLMNAETGESYLPLEVTDESVAAAMPRKGQSFVFDIRYFDSLADARGDAA